MSNDLQKLRDEKCQSDCDEYRKKNPDCFGYDFGNAWRLGYEYGRREKMDACSVSLMQARSERDEALKECENWDAEHSKLFNELKEARVKITELEAEVERLKSRT